MLTFVLWAAGPGWAAEDLSDRFDVQSSDRRTEQLRPGSLLRSVATVRLTNTGDRAVTAPLHAVVHFTGASDLSQVQLEGAEGGPGADPYGTFFFDLSAMLADGRLEPGASVAFPFVKGAFRASCSRSPSSRRLHSPSPARGRSTGPVSRLAG